MSKGFSSVQLKGTLGKDPELRSTPNGTRVANFSLAVERGYGDKTQTDWHNCVAWKDLADFVEKYLKKGKSVYVTGELQVRSWDDKNTGQKRYVTEIKADRIEFADDGGGSKSGSAPRQERSAPAPQTRQQAAPEARTVATNDPFEDPEDLPF